LEKIDEQAANEHVLKHVQATQINFKMRLTKIEENSRKREGEWLMTKVADLIYDAYLCSTSLENTLDISGEDLQLCHLEKEFLGCRSDDLIPFLNTTTLSEFGLSVQKIETFYI
jgi:hypothetical protein